MNKTPQPPPLSAATRYFDSQTPSGFSDFGFRYFANLQKQVYSSAITGQISEVTAAGLPTNLGLAAAGSQYYVTDYAHLLLWTGTAWAWAPAELGSGFVVNFLQATPPGVGWHLCDGSKVSMLQSNGVVEQVQLPEMGKGGKFGNLAAYFRQ